MMAGELAAALVAAQAEMPKVPKRGTNPHFRSQFVTLDDLLDAVRPILNRHGLAVVQMPTMTLEGQPALQTTILHVSGEQISSDMPLVLAKADMQGVGAAITYARRYMLAAALGIAEGTDDDGNQASAPDNSRSRPERRVEGGVAVQTPKTWAQVQESVRDCDNPDEAWAIFQAFGRAASYHLYGETNPKKLSKEQNRVMLQKAAGAAIWLHESEHVKYQGEFRYFGEPEQRGAWASVLDGHLLEIPDYKPPPKPEQADLSDEELKAEADRLVGEYEAAIKDIE